LALLSLDLLLCSTTSASIAVTASILRPLASPHPPAMSTSSASLLYFDYTEWLELGASTSSGSSTPSSSVAGGVPNYSAPTAPTFPEHAYGSATPRPMMPQ
uniref:Uncharacterized protein n=1 Tax=Triticum urartu TaxID=4572 RepID=A0A8R7Q2U9_TRIUA